MSRYVIVTFTKENSISAVPESWISKDYCFCFWPKTSIVRPLIKQRSIPKTTWEKFKVRVFRDRCGNIRYFDSLEVAERMVVKAEDTSDLTTDTDEDAPKDANNSSNRSPPRFYDFELMDTDMVENISLDGSLSTTLTPLREVVPHSPAVSDQSTNFVSNKNRCECKDILEKLSEQLARLQVDVTEIKQLLRQDRTVSEIEEKIELPKLPTRTIEDFLNLEEYTKVPQQANALIKHLATIGGINIGSATRRIWSVILTDSVSNQLSWVGAHQKIKLQGLNINRIVIVAVRRIIPNATDIEILSATKVWFRKSAERLKKIVVRT